MICIDTNVAINAMNRRNPSVRHRMGEQLRSGAAVALPVICLYELLYGHARSERPDEADAILEKFLSVGIQIAPFERADAREAGSIRAHLEAIGKPIGPYDTLIAAQARRLGSPLATLNVREFARVPGLKVLDWSK